MKYPTSAGFTVKWCHVNITGSGLRKRLALINTRGKIMARNPSFRFHQRSGAPQKRERVASGRHREKHTMIELMLPARSTAGMYRIVETCLQMMSKIVDAGH
jgi:hypothetical protein